MTHQVQCLGHKGSRQTPGGLSALRSLRPTRARRKSSLLIGEKIPGNGAQGQQQSPGPRGRPGGGPAPRCPGRPLPPPPEPEQRRGTYLGRPQRSCQCQACVWIWGSGRRPSSGRRRLIRQLCRCPGGWGAPQGTPCPLRQAAAPGLWPRPPHLALLLQDQPWTRSESCSCTGPASSLPRRPHPLPRTLPRPLGSGPCHPQHLGSPFLFCVLRPVERQAPDPMTHRQALFCCRDHPGHPGLPVVPNPQAFERSRPPHQQKSPFRGHLSPLGH